MKLHSLNHLGDEDQSFLPTFIVKTTGHISNIPMLFHLSLTIHKNKACREVIHMEICYREICIPCLGLQRYTWFTLSLRIHGIKFKFEVGFCCNGSQIDLIKAIFWKSVLRFGDTIVKVGFTERPTLIRCFKFEDQFSQYGVLLILWKHVRLIFCYLENDISIKLMKLKSHKKP